MYIYIYSYSQKDTRPSTDPTIFLVLHLLFTTLTCLPIAATAAFFSATCRYIWELFCVLCTYIKMCIHHRHHTHIRLQIVIYVYAHIIGSCERIVRVQFTCTAFLECVIKIYVRKRCRNADRQQHGHGQGLDS